jgi:hypothetical protein
MLGGVPLHLHGTGFNDYPSANPFLYGEHSLGVDIVQPYELSESDVFSSCPVNGIIAFTTPSVMDLYSATWADFNGAGQLPANTQKFTLRV